MHGYPSARRGNCGPQSALVAPVNLDTSRILNIGPNPAEELLTMTTVSPKSSFRPFGFDLCGPLLMVGMALGAGCAPPEPASQPLPAGVRLTVDQPLVLMDDVRVPTEDSMLRTVTVQSDGRLRFSYGGVAEIPFEVGQVIVGNEGRGYMGRVQAVADEGLDRWVTLTPVGLDEVLAEGAFTLRVQPDEEELAFVSDDGVGRRMDRLGGDFDLVPSEILDGAGSCEGVGAGAIRFRHHVQTRKLDTELIFKRSGFLGTTVDKAGSIVRGGATLTLELQTSGAIDTQCSLDVIDALNRAGVGIRPVVWEKSFTIGGILPVSMRFQMTPQLLTDASVVVEPTSMTATVQVSADLEAGVVYERGTGVRPVMGLDRGVGFDLDIDEGGNASAQASFHAGLYFELDINMLKLPKAGAELDAHARFRTDDAACTFAWDAGVSGSLWARGEVGVDLGFFSHTFADLDESIGFSETTRGGDSLSLPYCADDTCMTNEECIGLGEVCKDGVCVQDEPAPGSCDCAPGEICRAGLCFADPSGIVTCDACNSLPGMGWCTSNNRCVPASEAGACPGDFATSRSACVDCTAHKNCGDCAGDGFCGWVRSEGRCVNDELHRESVPASDYISTPNWCS